MFVTVTNIPTIKKPFFCHYYLNKKFNRNLFFLFSLEKGYLYEISNFSIGWESLVGLRYRFFGYPR